MYILFFLLLLPLDSFSGKCEVCIKVMDDIRNTMNKKDIRNKTKIEDAVDAYCGGSRIGPREKKLCYYISPIKRSIAHPFSLSTNSKYICERITKDNPEICTVKFPVQTKKMKLEDVGKLRVKQLKSILADRGVECKGCVEKAEYVKMVQDTEHLRLYEDF